jgi:hypothetical protein
MKGDPEEVTNKTRRTNLIVPDVGLNSLPSFVSPDKMAACRKTGQASSMRSSLVERCSRSPTKFGDHEFREFRTNFGAKIFAALLPLLLLSPQSCLAQEGATSDERCFLQAGGSTASFFVKEPIL